MKSITHKINTKFEAGQKVYYKLGKSDVRRATIKRIEIKTVLKKNKDPVTKVSYIARAKHSKYKYYTLNRSFTEDQLYSEADAEKKLLPALKKKKLMEKIKRVKQSIASNKASVTRAQKKLDSIRKEELVEELAGIK